MKRLMFLFLIIGMTAGCTPEAPPSVTINPSPCVVEAGAAESLSLNGQVPQGARFAWTSSGGSISYTGLGITANFVAPDTTDTIIISVTADYGTPGSTPVGIASINCTIINGNGPSVPTTEAQPTPGDASTIIPPTPAAWGYPIVISEVMGNVCGTDEFIKWNQYIELYNNSDQPVDVGDLWLYDSSANPSDTGRRLAAWTILGNAVLDNAGLVTTSTIIPARGLAVVLSPTYAEGLSPYKMPYQLPANTVILTVADSRTLGDAAEGISSKDLVILYAGGQRVVQKVISSYGSPKDLNIAYLSDLIDNKSDSIPYGLQECHSAERISPQEGDVATNWRQVFEGTPGEAPYP